MPRSTAVWSILPALRAHRRAAVAAALAVLAISAALAAESPGGGAGPPTSGTPTATLWLVKGSLAPPGSIAARLSGLPDQEGTGRVFLPRPPGFRGRAPLRAPGSWDFGKELLERMEREARRVRLEPQHGFPGADEPLDSGAESLRSAAAERIFSRSFRRTLEGHLESLARSSDRFGGAIAWLEGFGARQGREPASSGAGFPGEGTAPERGRNAPGASLGIRLDAHPRLLLRASALSFQGRIEIPLLDRAPRLSVERPLGAYGRARLAGGRDRVSGSWTTLSFSFTY